MCFDFHPKTLGELIQFDLRIFFRWVAKNHLFSSAFKEELETTTLPETNSSPLKMDGWNTTFLLGRSIFRGYVSFREGNS